LLDVAGGLVPRTDQTPNSRSDVALTTSLSSSGHHEHHTAQRGTHTGAINKNLPTASEQHKTPFWDSIIIPAHTHHLLTNRKRKQARHPTQKSSTHGAEVQAIGAQQQHQVGGRAAKLAASDQLQQTAIEEAGAGMASEQQPSQLRAGHRAE
jgi:hypothetical protein